MKKTPPKTSSKAPWKKLPVHPIEKFTTWVGSPSSLIFHTLVFVIFFALSFSHILSWDSMFLILTTLVSLEAIYLAIFIQMSVNRQAASLKEVEKDIGEIQEDVDEIQEDVEELSEDVEEIQEDIEEISEEEGRDDALQRKQMVTLETLTKDVERLLRDMESFQNNKK